MLSKFVSKSIVRIKAKFAREIFYTVFTETDIFLHFVILQCLGVLPLVVKIAVKKNKDKSFFSLPTEPSVRAAWVRAISGKNLPNNILLCSDHFDGEKDFT